MKWDEMTARERDALVGAKVMNYDIFYSAPDTYGWIYPRVKRRIGAIDCPHYTTKISAAWEVVEKMNAEWYTGIQRVSEFATPSGQWHCEMGGNHGYGSAPEAICLAALRAMGVEV